MESITSVSNSLVKEYAKLAQKKYRNETGKFLIEGYKAIKEAYDYGIVIERIFVTPSHINEYGFAKDKLVETTDAVLKKISTTEGVVEAVAIGFQKKYDKLVLENAKKVILLENIRDLGNLGTIIRSAVAFGVEAIILYGDCADIYNPKCVRASVGQLWKLPILNINDIRILEDMFSNFDRVATLPRAKNLLKTFKPSKDSILLMFGSEANGLSQDLVDFATNSVKIEMSETVESLNLATSVSVIAYEIFVC